MNDGDPVLAEDSGEFTCECKPGLVIDVPANCGKLNALGFMGPLCQYEHTSRKQVCWYILIFLQRIIIRFILASGLRPNFDELAALCLLPIDTPHSHHLFNTDGISSAEEMREPSPSPTSPVRSATTVSSYAILICAQC